MNINLIPRLRTEWFGNVRGDVLAGLVVALALIPEAIAFSIIAGVDPKIGLYASFSIAVVVAITGGRPGMISAATAATAVHHQKKYLLNMSQPLHLQLFLSLFLLKIALN